ncbi:unnamed protein product [Meganyctiphanes norvegica]|uniref:Uncharacterized protein n=1 Tax=Meganyctiphanes norvegica TaxID=48144 RepID=A0AAV2PSK3_MEGNR
MLREMSYTSLPQDESSGSERSTFITQGLMEYSPRTSSSSASHQKITCFIISLILFISAALAIIIPILLDSPSSGGEGADGAPSSSQLSVDHGLSYLSNLLSNGGQSNVNGTLTSSVDHQNNSNTEIYKPTTGNPNDDLTWKVVNTGDNIYIVPVYNNNSHTNNTQTNDNTNNTTSVEGNSQLLSNMTIHNTTSLVNNTIINAAFIVNGTESANTSGYGVVNATVNHNVQPNITVHEQVNGTNGPIIVNATVATTQLQQNPTAKPNEELVTYHIAPEQPGDHTGSPWQPYQNDSYSAIHKTSVISSLDNMTLVVLVALIAVSLSTLVAALAFLIHVKMETRKRRRNIANVITDLQSPDKIILLNSDESDNTEDSDEEYGRH